MKKLILIACLLLAATAGAIEFKDLILRDDSTFKKVIASTGKFANLSSGSVYSTAANGQHFVSVANTIPFAGTKGHGIIFSNATTMYYQEGSTAKRMGSGGGGVTDTSSLLAKATFNSYTSNDRATVTYVNAQIAGVSTASGLVSVPQYSDTACTQGQYALNSTDMYVCKATNTWGKMTINSSGLSATPTLTAQTITWNTQPAAMTVGGSDQTLTMATASSGLTIAYTTDTTTYCTIAGAVLHAVAAGTCVVHADQAGNGTYSAATRVDSGNITISAGGAYLVQEPFTSGAPSGWTTGTGITYTSGVLTMTSAASPVDTAAFTASDTVWVYQKIKFPTMPASETQVMYIMDSADEILVKVYVGSDGSLGVEANGGFQETGSAGVITANTDMWVKVRYTKGTGANAIGTIYHSTNGTSWTQDVSSTLGTTTTQATYVKLGTASGGVVRDDYAVATTDQLP